MKIPSYNQFIAYSEQVNRTSTCRLHRDNTIDYKNLPFHKELWWTQWYSNSTGTVLPQLQVDKFLANFLHECAHLVQAQRRGKDVTDCHFGLGNLTTLEHFRSSYKWEVEVFVYEKALAEKYNWPHGPINIIGVVDLESQIEQKAKQCNESTEIGFRNYNRAKELSIDDIEELLSAGLHTRASKVEEWINKPEFTEYRNQLMCIAQC